MGLRDKLLSELRSKNGGVNRMIIHKKICDICGEEIIRDGDLVVKQRLLWPSAYDKRVDICADCAKEMWDLIKNRRSSAE